MKLKLPYPEVTRERTSLMLAISDQVNALVSAFEDKTGVEVLEVKLEHQGPKTHQRFSVTIVVNDVKP